MRAFVNADKQLQRGDVMTFGDVAFWLIKIAGTIVSVGAGVVGLFTESIFRDGSKTLKPRTFLLIALITLGGMFSFGAEFIKDEQEKAASQTLARNVVRGVFPFDKPKFGITLTVDLTDPFFFRLRQDLRYLYNTEAKPQLRYANGNIVSAGRFVDTLWVDPSHNGRPQMQIKIGKPLLDNILFNNMHAPPIARDVFERLEKFVVFPPGTTTDEIVKNRNVTVLYEAILRVNPTFRQSYNQPSTPIELSRGPVLYYSPKQGNASEECMIYMDGPGLIVQANTSISGISDLAGKRYAIISEQDEQATINLELQKHKSPVRISFLQLMFQNRWRLFVPTGVVNQEERREAKSDDGKTRQFIVGTFPNEDTVFSNLLPV